MKRYLLFGIVIALCAGAGVGVYIFSSPPTDEPRGVAKPSAIDPTAVLSKADSGDPVAEVQLARMYAKGEGVTNNYAEAAKWFRRAAEQTNADALVGLGELYEAGQGVPKDLQEAVKLYRQAAEQGNADGQYTLAFMYESGRGLRQSHVEAAKWYQKAAEQGQVLAQYDLGQRYVLGVGVPADQVEGLKWLILAAGHGQTDAATLRDKIKKQLTSSQVAEARRRAAEFSPRKQPPA